MSAAAHPAQVIVSASLVFLLGAISPGPNFVLVAATAARSRTAALQTAFGFALAALTWASLSALGLALLVSKVGWIYASVQIAGGIYLIFLGLRLMLTTSNRADDRTPQTLAGTGAVWRGFATNLVNPKSAAFFTAIFASFVPVSAPTWLLVAVIGSVGAVSLGWYSALALVLSTESVRAVFERGRRVLDLLCGGILLTLGVRLIVVLGVHAIARPSLP